MNLTYVQNSLHAALRLAVRDPQAWGKFDLTADGFFRSFVAILLVAPINILYDLFDFRLAQARALSDGKIPSSIEYGFAEVLFSTAALAIGWFVFPLVLLFLLRFLDLSHRYATMVIAHNWGSVVIQLFNVPAIILFSVGLISHQIALDLLFVTFGLALYYRFYIAQTALDIGWGLAVGISMLELLMSIFFVLAVSDTRFLWLPSSS